MRKDLTTIPDSITAWFITHREKIKAKQIWKMNYKYDDNYTFNLYHTLDLFKVLFCPLSHVIISMVFIRDERMERLLNLLLWPIYNFWYHQFETTNGKRFSLLFLLQKSSVHLSVGGSLSSHFGELVLDFSINVTRIFSFWVTWLFVLTEDKSFIWNF